MKITKQQVKDLLEEDLSAPYENWEIKKEDVSNKILQLFQPSEQWKFIDAVNSVKSGSHQIERDCDNLELLKAVLKASFPQCEYKCVGDKNFYAKTNLRKKNWGAADNIEWFAYPIILLSEIQPEEVKIEDWGEVLKEAIQKNIRLHSEIQFKNGDEVECSFDREKWSKVRFIGLASNGLFCAENKKKTVWVYNYIRKPNTRLSEIKAKLLSLNYPFMTDEIADKFSLELYNEERNKKL